MKPLQLCGRNGCRILITSLALITVWSLLAGCSTYPAGKAGQPVLYTDDDFRVFSAYAADRFLKGRLQSHPESRGFALLIGIDDNNYSGTPALTRPVYETSGLKAKLEACGYAVKMLVNREATRTHILEWLQYFSGISRKPDLFFLFYSGHGFTPAESREKLAPALKALYFPASGTGSRMAAYQRDFHMLCYQDDPDYDDRNNQLITSAVGSYEILDILGSSRFSEKIEIIDACTATHIDITLPVPPPVNYYSLERQGFFFCCLLKDQVLDGEFMPVIFPGLDHEADTLTGNRDGVVSVFELINYTNSRRDQVFRMAGIRDNDIKYIIYCSSDIPLTISEEARGRDVR